MQDDEQDAREALPSSGDSILVPGFMWYDDKEDAEITDDPLLLALYAEHKHWIVRLKVAGNPHTPTAVLMRLRNDRHGSVQGAAKGNLSQG